MHDHYNNTDSLYYQKAGIPELMETSKMLFGFCPYETAAYKYNPA